MPMISVEYDYAVPNSFMSDHSFSNGNTRTTTYDGPDKIYLIVDDEGKEHMGPLTAEEKADGRPLPLGCHYHEVDCIENPLFCQLRAPVIDEAEEDHTSEMVHPDCTPVEGYETVMVQTPILPRNIYDKYNTHVNPDGTLNIPVFTVVDSLFGGSLQTLPDWEYVRRKRAYELDKTDGRISSDMPQALQDAWMTYRQRLRDLPDALAANPPWIAVKMFPLSPDDKQPPKGSLPTIL